MRATLILCALFALLCAGCATERYVPPTISTAPRTGLSLKTPVITSIYDGRTTGADPSAAEALQSELSKIYGSNLQWAPYFDSVPNGRVAVRLRIVMLGSSFGSRLISSASYATAIQSARFSAPGPWGPVVGSATGSSSILAGSISGEGWWNGAAWVDVEVQDNRGSTPGHFTIPLAAEHRESNMLGYASGDKAARKAWEKVSAQLTRTLDEVLRVLRDEEG